MLWCYDEYMGAINSTNKVLEPPPVLNVSSHFSESPFIRKTYLFWQQQCFCCSTKVLHTVVMLTPKRCPMLWYSEPVASFHTAMATHFYVATRRNLNSQKPVSCRSMAVRTLLHKMLNVSSDIRKFCTHCASVKLGTITSHQ